jgi:hypothetical protein
MNHWRRLLIVLGALVVPRPALAADPTKLECIAANDAAQDLRLAGKLGNAREKLALCVSTSCPGPVRDDCAQRLAEVDAAMPGIVLEVKDARGNDVSDVRVKLDGQPFTDRIDGTAQPIDPGSHRFAFDTAEGTHAERWIVVREKEKDTHVRVVLGTADATPTVSPSSTGRVTQRAIGFALGVAGVAGFVVGGIFGVVSKSTYSHALSSECGGNPNQCSTQGANDGQTAHDQATVSTIGFVAGGLLVAGGAVLYFTAPKTSGVVVGASGVGNGGAGMIVRGTW